MFNEEYFAADLQKVIMLPRLPGMKTAIFTRRIILFHETFVPLGGHGSRPYGYIWHEGIRGRNDEDLCSVFIKFLENPRFKEVNAITITNCSAQNKNWTLYSGLVHHVNLSNTLKLVRLKYFEKGHTWQQTLFMPLEKEMKATGKIYGFADFTKVINSHGLAVVMDISDFRELQNELSNAKDTVFPSLVM